MTERRIWIDDIRNPPSEYTDWAITSNGAISILRDLNNRNLLAGLEEISFDHDLGGDDTTMRVMDWMIENDVWPAMITIHTANPVGRQNLLRAANRYAPPEVDIYVKY